MQEVELLMATAGVMLSLVGLSAIISAIISWGMNTYLSQKEK